MKINYIKEIKSLIILVHIHTCDAMGANKRAARPDSPAFNFSLLGRGMLDGQGVIRTASSPSSISAPRAADMLRATLVSSQSLSPCSIVGESANNAAAIKRALRLFEGGAVTSPESVLGETRMIMIQVQVYAQDKC